MYKFVAYIPQPNLETVKDALFAAGAGHFGKYDRCSWQVLGMGQFRPLTGANPAIGAVGVTELVPEWRVEMVVLAEHLPAVIQAYKDVHPYEVPAYDVYALVVFDE